jgi:uncharacterized membrane protein
MVRVLWIIGLSISLLVFGGFTVMCVIGLILRHHLNGTGVVVLLSNGFISWMIVDYMRLKIREPKRAQPPASETPDKV